MPKGKRGKTRTMQGRYIASEVEMRARDDAEIKSGKRREEDALKIETESETESNINPGSDEEVSEITLKLRQPFLTEETPLIINNLIEIENPNKTKKNPQIKPLENPSSDVGELSGLTRREKEVILSQREKLEQFKLASQGQTEESKADLQRLEQIRKERELQRKRREEEILKKEQLKQAVVERSQELENKAKALLTGKKKKGKK